MKPFDIELAKKGHPVCTRDGRPVRIICFDRISEKYPIVGLVKVGCKEETHIFTDKGKYISDDKEKDFDLFMSPEKKEGWINLYKDKEIDLYCTGASVYATKEKAQRSRRLNGEYLATIKIEWEE